ncbi:hypothetical protein G039_0310115 [Pseudomonas aeruginosa VRFPA01]|nr:hypothetical protein G039_0310115 [Pseudomonas aeruginosa VRFPA01]
MSASILNAQNLSKVVGSAEGKLTILHDLSLDLARGDSLAIVGSSGSGKSTLLGLLAGLDQPVAAKSSWPGTPSARSTRTSAHASALPTSASYSSRSSCSTASTPWRTSCCRWSWKAARTPASAPANCSSGCRGAWG